MIREETLSLPARSLTHANKIFVDLTREYIITPSLRDGLPSLTNFWHFVPGRLRRPRRARQPGVRETIFCGRDVGFAESGYYRAVPSGQGMFQGRDRGFP